MYTLHLSSVELTLLRRCVEATIRVAPLINCPDAVAHEMHNLLINIDDEAINHEEGNYQSIWREGWYAGHSEGYVAGAMDEARSELHPVHPLDEVLEFVREIARRHDRSQSERS